MHFPPLEDTPVSLTSPSRRRADCDNMQHPELYSRAKPAGSILP